MEVEEWWKVHMRCANGYRQETRSMRKCVYRKLLDLEAAEVELKMLTLHAFRPT
jgi:hypothetical protein